MTRHAMLNNVEHKDLRVETRRGAEYGDNIMYALTVPSEFRKVVADYPIFFYLDAETDKYSPVVMFGFQRGENLYLDGQKWQATYIPLMVQRGPFSIGLQSMTEGADATSKMVISVDMEHPRVGVDEGEPMFQPFGDNSEYTDKIVQVLHELEHGQAMVEEFTTTLLQHDLIEPFTLGVELNNGAKHSLEGFHTIHEEKLAALDGKVLEDLSRRGILQACYLVVASMANIPRLIEFKNRLL